MDAPGTGSTASRQDFAAALVAEERRLRLLIGFHLPQRIRTRCSVDDVWQELGLAGMQRLDHWQAYAHVPAYVRLRSLALQVIADCCRRHLADKRDCAREVAADDRSGAPVALENWLAASATSPLSRLAQAERLAAMKELVERLSPADREILALRHGEELGNQEAAAILGIEVKAASIRYVRALQRLRDLMAAQGWSVP